MENKSAKTIVLEAYKYIIGQCNMDMIDTYVSDTYIQHSPTVKDGKAGLIEMIGFLKTIPRTGEARSPVVRVIADGDLVAAHLDVTFMGKRMAVVDIFKVEQGKLAEHWDAAQTCPQETDEAVTMTNGATTVEQLENTKRNKAITEHFCRNLFENRDLAMETAYLRTGYIEHSPGLINGTEARPFFAGERLKSHSLKVHRVLGEGNFTVVQSAGTKEEEAFVYYDIFRIEDDKIAEHWSVEQAVPVAMAHTNGMI